MSNTSSRFYENYKGYKIYIKFIGKKNLTPGSGCTIEFIIDNLETLAKYITKVNDYNDIENLPHFIQNLYLFPKFLVLYIINHLFTIVPK